MNAYARIKAHHKKQIDENKKMHTKSRYVKPFLARNAKFTAAIAAAAVLIVGTVSIPPVRAATVGQLQDKIDSLNAKNADNQDHIDGLQVRADNYHDAIKKLQSEISAVQHAIQANQAKQVSLKKKIAAYEKKIDEQKKLLGGDIKAMYVKGDISTIEMFASSKNLSDFVNAQTYRSAVQSNIQDALTHINQLENKLKDKKTKVQTLIQTEKGQKSRLAHDRAQEKHLLSLNKSQQAAFSKKIKKNTEAMDALQAKINEINSRSATSLNIPGGSSTGACDNGFGTGGYPSPWCNADKDSIFDSWGILNRECTSYAYWYYKHVEGHHSFSASGNAKDWAYTYQNVSRHTEPRVGSIGVSTAPPEGHVMIVRAIGPTTWHNQYVPAGSVLVSDMNHDLHGHFSYNIRATHYDKDLQGNRYTRYYLY